jgi:SPP1 family predicted phage head-tail adaptor
MARRATAGSLDERVTFERVSRVSDGGGGGVESWATLYECWAKVTPLSGRERDNAAQTQAPRNYRVTVRVSAETLAVTEADRVMWRGAAMDIRFIADAGPRPLYLQIDCEAGVVT